MAGRLTFLSAVLLLAGSVATLFASVAGLRELRIPNQMQVHVAAGGVCIGTLLIRFLALTGFPNDHFLYLAPAQQMLAGELPSRDFVDPGTPLMYLVSFLARLLGLVRQLLTFVFSEQRDGSCSSSRRESDAARGVPSPAAHR